MVRRTALALAFVALVAGPAHGAEQVTLRMEGWWGGLKSADILFIALEADGGWNGDVEIRSAGLVRWLSGLRADIRGHGPLDGAGALPESYIQHVVTRRSERTVAVDFAGAPPLGRRLSDQETLLDPAYQKRDPEAVPDLPEAQRRATMDPIAAILTLGRRVLAGERRFTLPVYDGRRRFDLAVERGGANRHPIGGRVVDTLDAVAVVHPLGGFRPFHLRLWTDAKFEIYLDPKTGLPLRISSSSFGAAVVVTAHAVCPPDPVCALPPLP